MDSKQVIEALGGTTRVAEMCGIRPQAVSQWKKNGIPRAWVRFLQCIRPEVFKKAVLS